MRLAILRVRYEYISDIFEVAKSELFKWLKVGKHKRTKLPGEALELDEVWTRVADGNAELKSARDERGVALASAGSWEDALTMARNRHVPGHRCPTSVVLVSLVA